MMLPPIYHRLRARWQTLPRETRLLAIAALTVAAALGSYAIFRGDPVERAVARGDLHAAKTELRQRQTADAGARSYDTGRIAEAQGSFRAAAASYVTATRQGDERGLERLIEMTRDRSCPARSAAASALGALHDQRGVRALKELRRGEVARQHQERAPPAPPPPPPPPAPPAPQRP